MQTPSLFQGGRGGYISDPGIPIVDGYALAWLPLHLSPQHKNSTIWNYLSIRNLKLSIKDA
jgi:hypothetical protein